MFISIDLGCSQSRPKKRLIAEGNGLGQGLITVQRAKKKQLWVFKRISIYLPLQGSGNITEACVKRIRVTGWEEYWETPAFRHNVAVAHTNSQLLLFVQEKPAQIQDNSESLKTQQHYFWVYTQRNPNHNKRICAQQCSYEH